MSPGSQSELAHLAYNLCRVAIVGPRRCSSEIRLGGLDGRQAAVLRRYHVDVSLMTQTDGISDECVSSKIASQLLLVDAVALGNFASPSGPWIWMW